MKNELDIDGKYLRHQLYLERLATGEINSVLLPNMNETRLAIGRLLSDIDVIKTPAELNKITKAITEQINSDKGWATITASLESMAIYESAWQASFLGAAFAEIMNVPKGARVVQYVTRAIMSLESGNRIDAGIWADYVKANKDSQASTVNKLVINGYSRGQTGAEIRKQVNKVYPSLANQAETLTRTGFVHYAAQAGEAVILDNTDVLSEYYYVTVLDNRRSDICIGIEKFNKIGNRYKVGDLSAPVPPLHWGCRTRRLGVTKGWQPTGDKPSINGRKSDEAEERFEAKKDRKEGGIVKYTGRKDKSLVAKPISARTSQDDWLRSNPDWFIRDTLKSEWKYDRFKAGASLDSFSDMNGKPLTLKQVVARDKRG